MLGDKGAQCSSQLKTKHANRTNIPLHHSLPIPFTLPLPLPLTLDDDPSPLSYNLIWHTARLWRSGQSSGKQRQTAMAKQTQFKSLFWGISISWDFWGCPRVRVRKTKKKANNKHASKHRIKQRNTQRNTQTNRECDKRNKIVKQTHKSQSTYKRTFAFRDSGS